MTRPNDVGVGTAVLITRKIMRSTGRFGNVWHPQVLLGKRRGAHGAGLWSLPGGWIDRSDATLEEAAVREVREETGLVLDPDALRLLCVQTKPYPDFRAVTLFYTAEYDPTPGVQDPPHPAEPGKCEAWLWFFIEEVPADLFDNLGRALRQFVEAGRAC